MRKLNVAVIGATGIVGKTIIEIIQNYDGLEVDNLYAFASEQALEQTVLFKNKQHAILDIDEFDFSNVDITFLAAPEHVAKKYANKIVDSGSFVIDSSAAFNLDYNVPLVIPEINGDLLSAISEPCIVSNPNCSVIQLCIGILPIQELSDINNIFVSTYQSVSGTGNKAISDLIDSTVSLLNGKSKDSTIYPKQIAFNSIPQVDEFHDTGYTEEEMKLHHETRKIFDDDGIYVNATAVRVPTIFGHAESVTVETSKPLSLDDITQQYQRHPYIRLFSGNDYPTTMTDAVNSDSVYVGRMRKSFNNQNIIQMWIVADNIRKGSALNAVQIATKIFNS